MFKNWFAPKCPVCKMKINEHFVEDMGQKFCSASCRDEYKAKVTGAGDSHGGGGCCCSHKH